MKRRSFLAFSAVGLVPVAARAAEVKWDVIVIGSGVAGLTAAASAAEQGTKVLLIEKSLSLGGHSILSTGYVSAVDPKRQKPLGIVDSPEKMLADMLEVGGYKNDVELARIVCENSERIVDWLEHAGVIWEDAVVQTFAGMFPRSHISSSFRAGYDYVVTLNNYAHTLGIAVALDVKAERLITNAHDEVIGVQVLEGNANAYDIHAKAVVVATGGFTANPELRMHYDPRLTPDFATTANPFKNMFDGATGDGLLMGLAIGADIKHAEYIQLIPFWGGRLLDYVGGDIFVNKEGLRFVSESAPWKTISDAILQQPSQEMWAITDAQSRKGASLAVKIANNVVYKSNTVKEMALKMNVSPHVLEKTIADYNKYAKDGIDPKFKKNIITQTIETPPYYFGKEKLGVHFCCGGLRFSPRAEVLKKNGDPIPGLYVAGEAAGGAHGHDRMGGVSMTTAFVFGRIAGIESGKLALSLRRQ